VVENTATHLHGASVKMRVPGRVLNAGFYVL
jgi:hypothetical protein